MEWSLMHVDELARIIRSDVEKVLIIDSRSFLEYNTLNIQSSVNVCCSKLIKRRLQQDKISICELLAQSCRFSPDPPACDVVVYDQCSEHPCVFTDDNFVTVILKKLRSTFKSVQFLQGGFLGFQASHPSLCQNKNLENPTSITLTSVSQPCLPVSSEGPTKILPFMFLGSQQDAFNQETAEVNGITYVLNVSLTSPKPAFIKDSHFLRIPVNDNYCAKLLPYFLEAFQFLEKVREGNGRVLIHCLAGISRSPTLAIAYLMKHLNMSMDEAYRYTKDKRPTISPNFNFLGQLLEYENVLNQNKETSSESKSANVIQSVLSGDSARLSSPTLPMFQSPHFNKTPDSARIQLNNPFVMNVSKSKEMTRSKSLSLSMGRPIPKFNLSLPPAISSATAQSPTTALSKLNFNATDSPTIERDPFTTFTGKLPTTSLDKLNFTACVAHDEQSSKQPDENTPTKGTKRPLSLRVSEDKNSKRDDGDYMASKAQVLAGVTLRSPEIRAKRPLVRPNSIAFSSYPTFDVDETTKSDTGCSIVSALETIKPSYSFGIPHSSSFANMVTEKTQGNNLPVENTLGKSKRSDVCRKSRSLEDILSSPEDEVTIKGCHNCFRKRAVATSDFYSGLPEAVQCRCRGMSDPHQSSSSISSGGSHNSLHGSLEIIQVS